MSTDRYADGCVVLQNRPLPVVVVLLIWCEQFSVTGVVEHCLMEQVRPRTNCRVSVTADDVCVSVGMVLASLSPGPVS